MEAPENAVHYLEIVTPDVDAARLLYSTAYGWRFEPAVAELGNAVVAPIPGGSLCGIRAPLHELETPVVRTYIRVSNLETATREAERLGAKILLESMELAGWGKISIYELGGIQQGLWQVP
ncbi:MAG TPA: hydroxylase [Thermoanaerobaculia bacterium]|nr:hydroxylase [Thermoanaerobaculia bacterium]